MNIPTWSYPLSPFHSSSTIIPSNYFYSYPYIQSPYANTNMMLNSSIPTSLNSSSGYESASNETSLIDSGFLSPSSAIKESHCQSVYQETYESMMMMVESPTGAYNRKKRRILSCSQRQEANRRERHRMEIINDAYENLRDVLPFKKGRKRQKMSRMDTVDGAIHYIHSLLETLHGPNYNPNWAKT